MARDRDWGDIALLSMTVVTMGLLLVVGANLSPQELTDLLEVAVDTTPHNGSVEEGLAILVGVFGGALGVQSYRK